jgi:putative spermidine/putrescine transport system substrate-binding protein
MAVTASAQELTLMSWGGAYRAAQTEALTEAQTEAHVKPFTAAPSMAAIMTDSDNPATPIKAMVEAGNVTLDMASVECADAIRLCDEGVLEPIDAASLPAGNDGVPATEDFFEGAITECGVSTDIWSNVYGTISFAAYAAPTTAADFILHATGFR